MSARGQYSGRVHEGLFSARSQDAFSALSQRSAREQQQQPSQPSSLPINQHQPHYKHQYTHLFDKEPLSGQVTDRSANGNFSARQEGKYCFLFVATTYTHTDNDTKKSSIFSALSGCSPFRASAPLVR